MKQRLSKMTLAVILITGFFVVQPCMAANTIKLGLAGPLTGDQAVLGDMVKNGGGIAIEEWNEKGGVLGKKIEALWGDDQHDPKQAVAIANKFINEGAVGPGFC